MKNQASFSLKDKSKKLKCHLLQFLFGALRVNKILTFHMFYMQKKKQMFCMPKKKLPSFAEKM